MLSNLAVVALAAAGVSAGPLQRRQDVTSAAASVASSVASAVTDAPSAAPSLISSAASSVASAASSVASAATTVASDATSAASSAASEATAASSAAASSVAPAGEGGSEAYPCPAGFLLTYAAVNQTFEMNVTEVTAAAGEWASSPLFPNVTDVMGASEPGAMHTINVGEIALPEVLVSVETNETSGSAIWNWNGSLAAPVSAMGVSLSNYSTVLQIYDPDFTTTGEIGNTTFVNIFTNACATPQAEAISLLTTLGGLELSNLAAALSGNMTMPSMVPSAAPSGAASTGMEMASSAVESATSAASSAVESASSAASSAASVASSAASSAAEGVTSAASAATSAVASAVSSVAA